MCVVWFFLLLLFIKIIFVNLFSVLVVFLFSIIIGILIECVKLVRWIFFDFLLELEISNNIIFCCCVVIFIVNKCGFCEWIIVFLIWMNFCLKFVVIILEVFNL